LVAFYREYGHCNVPAHYEDNPQLGQWVHNQRAEFKKYMKIYGKSLLLANETIKARVRKLNEIQFDWRRTGSKARSEKQVSVILI
jgi:hypothetical protein